jgi:DNA-binding MarR family transcriptional regulator
VTTVTPRPVTEEPVGAKPDLIRRITEEIRAYQRANDAIDELATARLGVNRTDGRCVDILEESGPMTAGQLAKLTGLTTGAITTALDRLEKAGLARREPDAHDRRKVLVELTDAGRRGCAEVYGPLVDRGLKEMNRYSVTELEVILDFLERCHALAVDHAEHVRAEGAPAQLNE